jgi:archaemetzincin
MKIILKPLGKITGKDKVLNTLSQSLNEVFGCAIEVAAEMVVPDSIYNVKRDQYNASSMLNMLAKLKIPLQAKILGITDVDAYIPELNYVFGLADLKGKAAIISLASLRQEFYGMPEDEPLFLSRAVKEALHELGHVFGLQHCASSSCVMHFSNSLHDTDIKQPVFCPGCRPQLLI